MVMKTIEERAQKYVGAPCDDGCAICDALLCKLNEYSAYIAGARSEHEELTRWHDPIDHPEEGVEVLCKYKSCSGRLHYITAWYSKFHKGYMNDGYIRPILGWREIHK